MDRENRGAEEEYLELAKRQQPIDARRLADLRALAKPPERRAHIERLLNLLRRADAEVGPLGRNFVSGDPVQHRAIERRLRRLVEPTVRLTGELRVPACLPDHVDPRPLR